MELSERFHRIGFFSIFFLSCLINAAAVHAMESDADEPLHINARSVEANEKTGVAIYTGDVQARQGRLSIRADRLEIRTRDHKTEFIRATGKPAKLDQQAGAQTEEIHAEANRIDYHVLDKKLDMMGNVSVRRTQDLFTGDVLHYDINRKSLNAAGDEKNDGRVHAVIQPKKQTKESEPSVKP